jgi:hypothetical protein
MSVFEPAEFEWKSIFCAHVTRGTGDFRGLSEGQTKRPLRLVKQRYGDCWICY